MFATSVGRTRELHQLDRRVGRLEPLTSRRQVAGGPPVAAAG